MPYVSSSSRALLCCAITFEAPVHVLHVSVLQQAISALFGHTNSHNDFELGGALEPVCVWANWKAVGQTGGADKRWGKSFRSLYSGELACGQMHFIALKAVYS